jgi:hypothetical protein
MIADARCGDVCLPEPLLHLGDVGLVIERVRGGGRAQRMGADLEAERGRIGAHQPVDAVGRDRPIQLASAVVAQRAEQGAGIVLAVPGRLKVFVNKCMGAGCSGR